NADITFTNGSFEVIPARAGSGIDQVALVQQLNAAFLGNDQTVFLTLATLPAAINDTAAQALADQCNQAIAQPVTMLGDQGENWSLTSDIMGPWLETHIQSDDQGTQLLATVSPDKLKASLGQVVGDYDPGVPATNASFQIVDNAVTIIPSQDGLGIDYPKLSTDLQAILFGPAGADRTITIAVSDLPPNLSTSGAEALHITDKISTFSTYYGFSTEARATNVQVASGYANNTLIAPGTVFSFLNTVGDATIARGFVSSKVISGGEYVDAIGGGVCQVATTVYNAVYDAGYPIVARSAHGLYQSQYPAGRDAAVYYPWLDMQWKNDTENWILLTVTCSQGYVTASLWGTDPGYVVKSEVSAWQPGEKYETQRVDDPTLVVGTEKVKQAGLDGRSITVTRRVYDAAGNLLRESVFKSTYGSVPEIIQVGTAPAPPPPPPPPPSNNNGSSTGDNNGSTGGQDSGGTDSSGDSTGGTGSQ
ncbi:MAG: VanW family protein, partial [Actinomycetia bacterium]|nr:VanW family protein [Actinomycetes bacterium]